MRRRTLVVRALHAATALAFAGCTLGLGDYRVRGETGTALDPTGTLVDATDETALSPDGGGADAGAKDAYDAHDPSDAQSDAASGGPCADGLKQVCNVPDGDGADAGTCTGEQKCIQGKWGPCVVSRRCPATWEESTTTGCKNTDAIGDSPEPKWTTNQAQGADQTLWAVTRTIPFDTYGQNDKFCFVPKQSGNCYATSTIAVDVVCTNNAMKLSGNHFEDGWIHAKVYCIDRSGPTCTVVDKHTAAWTAGPITCERWFESAAFVVESAPRCAPW